MYRDGNKSQEYRQEPLDDDHEVAARPRRHRRGDDEEAAVHQHPKRRNPWTCLLAGCVGAIFTIIIVAVAVIFVLTRSLPSGGLGSTGNSTYTSSQQQQLLFSNITQVQVHNQIGDVSLSVDPNAAMVTVTTVKKVKAANSAEASKEFGHISVQVQPQGTPENTLVVSVNIPDTSGNILGKASDAVDVMIVLPPAVSSNISTPLTVNVENSVGNVLIVGLDAMLIVKDDIGNVTVHQTRLVDGSHLETGTGNVIFDGNLATSGSSNANPCNNPSGSSHPMYKIQSEQGNVDVTLPVTTNVILDANVNVGMIKSDFNINVTNTDGSPSYCGPLLSNPPTLPGGVLVLDVSSGNIDLHKG
jgi:hypothetical protein